MSENRKNPGLPLRPEDYSEPACPVCDIRSGSGEIRPVPLDRIFSKLEQYYSVRDTAGAERHLLYWLAEAEAAGDIRGRLMLHNELMGHYRKQADRVKAFYHADRALGLIGPAGMDSTVTAATTFINAATVRQAFGESAQALVLFNKAYDICTVTVQENDARLAGLYNNMAICLAALREYDRARGMYEKALSIMRQQENGKPEEAITFLNMADLEEAALGPVEGEETIGRYLDTAYELLGDPDIPRNGYYAFVCEKCAPVYGYYGRFHEEAELKRRAAVIYAGS